MMVDEMSKTRAQQILEERARMENRDTHEISNRELKRVVGHRRKHRGEKFVSEGRDFASDGKTVKERVRNEHDKRLFDALGDERVNAMRHISAAFMIITSGMGLKTFDPRKIPGGMSASQCGDLLRNLYFRWATECQLKKLDHSACLDIVAFGCSPSEIDRRRAVRNGGAQANLRECLDVAIEIGFCNILKDGD